MSLGIALFAVALIACRSEPVLLPTPAAIATQTALTQRAVVQDFVGLYACHGWHFYGASLSIASDLRYVRKDRLEFMCSGEEGQVVVGPDRVWLVPEVEWDTCERRDEDVTRVPEAVRQASAELIPVKWGYCRLLVLEAQVTNFCQFLTEDKIECDCHAPSLDFFSEECLCYGRVGGVTHEGQPMLPNGTPVCP